MKIQFGRNKNFADPTASILSNFRFLRYITSFMSFLCCLLLPLSVEWDSNIAQDFLGLINSDIIPQYSSHNRTNDLSSFILSDSCQNSTSTTAFYFELHILMFYIAVMSCSSFIQLYFYFKLFMMCAAVCMYVVSFNLHSASGCLIRSSLLNNPFLKTEMVLKMIFFVVFLHLIDRRVSWKY